MSTHEEIQRILDCPELFRVYRYEIFDAKGRPVLLLVDESEAERYKANGYSVKTLYEKV